MQQQQHQDRKRLHGIETTIQHARDRDMRAIRVRNPSPAVRAKLEQQGHRVGEPDDDNRVMISLDIPEEDPVLDIDNPDPPQTP